MDIFIEEIVKQGGGYILAAFALIMLNVVWKARTDELKDRLVQEREDKLAMLNALTANTAALVEFKTTMAHSTEVLTQLSARLEQSTQDLAAHRLEEEAWIGGIAKKQKRPAP